MTEKQELPLLPNEPEKTFIKGLSLHSFAQGGGAVRVDTRNGRMVRIRPLHYEEKYTPEEIGQWKVEAPFSPVILWSSPFLTFII